MSLRREVIQPHRPLRQRWTVGVWGLGKAGGSLATSLNGADIQMLAYSRQPERRAAFAARAPNPQVLCEELDEFLRRMQDVRARVLFIAVPDDVIASVAEQLSQSPWLPPVVAHLSGSRGAEALVALKSRTRVSSFHPLAALDGISPIPDRCLLAIDASTISARRFLIRIAKKMSLEPVAVQEGGHAKYHLGASTTANLAIALLAESIDLLVDVGIPPELARQGLARLLISSATAAFQRPLSAMLTGPVARGDATTVARHLAVLDESSEQGNHEVLALVYRKLSQKLLTIAKIDDEKRQILEKLLEP